MKEDYSLLLIGQFYDNHSVRFVRNLKRFNPKAQIDYFTPVIRGKEIPSDYLEYFRAVEMVDFSHLFRYFPLLNKIEERYNWLNSFRSFSRDKHYDVVNIHYPRSINSLIIPELHEIADSIVLTPWGSDVLRSTDKERRVLQRLYETADYVTGHGDRFTDEFMRIFNVPKQKFIHVDLGTETIDYIAEHKTEIGTKQAKQQLGIEGSYAITCGYNASPAQNHLKIIESIGRIKEQLPHNLVLLFPLTYPKNPDYVIQLKNAVDNYGLRALWFEQYMDLASLFILRQATDMFIHVQKTDANNASLKEYLLLGKNCINGAWLQYPDVEDNGRKPYYEVQSVDDLDANILKSYQNGAKTLSPKATRIIKSFGCKPAAVKWNQFFMSISK